MSPAALPRRSTAGAFLAGVVEAVSPSSSTSTTTTAATTAAVPTAATTASVTAVPPRMLTQTTTVPVQDAPARASTINRAYKPRAAVPGPTSGTRTAARGVLAARSATGTPTPTPTPTPTASPSASPSPSPTPTPSPTSTTTDAAALHLARRATWGATPQLVAEIKAQGLTAWVDAQLNPTTIGDGAMDSLLASTWPRLSLATWEVKDTYFPNSTGDLGYDITESYVARALWSRRQLLEVLVDFWTNHLVVTAPWGEAWDSVHRFHIDVIRKHALGRYADMLVAAAKHPAMLKQLDNDSSTKRAPNENFGREVLELHTVGVDGGYLESEIRSSALALTGMSTDQESGEYQYRHIRHHRGPLTVMAWSHANASAFGEPVGEAYLTYLARHPKTARRIATKLCVRFVADTPPSTLVDRLAQVYLDNDTRIAPVVRALLTSAEFAASAGQKTKRPLEDIVSTCRVLGVSPGTNTKGWLGDINWYARVAGQAPMSWPAPNGYPDVAGAWSGTGTTLARWNFHMSQGWTAVDANAKVAYPALRGLLPATLPATYGAYVDALAARLLLVPLSAPKRDAICAFLDKTAATALKSTDAAVGWRLPYVVALVLDAPEFATR